MKTILRCCVFFLLLIALRAQAAPAPGYWWNPAEGGRGFVIEVQGNTMFMAGFLYDVSGRASWVGSTGPMTTATTYSGTLTTYSGGQSLTGTYKSPAVSPSLGNISINFLSNTTATLTWPGGTIPIQRFDIVPNGSTTGQPATNPQPGWWWNESEGGRGFAVEVQNGTMYLAAYMYDSSGNPLWYLASGAMTNTTLFQGAWTQYANGETLTGAFKQASLANGNVGSVTVSFANNSTAVMTLPDGRQIPFTRFSFGYSGITLAAFSPAASPPAQLLQLSGTGFDTAQTIQLKLFDDAGYSVTLPPVSATTNALSVSVPAYLDPVSSFFTTGTVKLQASQSSAFSTQTSNVLTGFQIKALPVSGGSAGRSTLALVRASLAEAQRLQTAIVGTPQNTTAVQAALATQVTNLQTLVNNVNGVVTNGTSFTLGAVGGVNITVTAGNITDVDNLILATLQALTSPNVGSTLNTKSAAAAGTTCLSAEAAAYATAATTGNTSIDTIAQALLKAPATSAACAQTADVLAAYRIFTGPNTVGLAVTNQGGFGTVPKNLQAAALLSALFGNASTSVALNALAAQPVAASQTTIQAGVANVNSLVEVVYDTLLPKTTGTLLQTLTSAQTVSAVVAPPPVTSGGSTGGGSTGLTAADTASITALFTSFGAYLSNPSTTSTDPGLLALFDSANFLDDGSNLTRFLNRNNGQSSGTIAFSGVTVMSSSPVTSPTTAIVQFLSVIGGTPRNYNFWTVNKVGGNWLLAGDQHKAQADVITFATYTDASQTYTGLQMEINDRANIGLSYAIVTGKGLPTGGQLLVPQGGGFHTAVFPYQGANTMLTTGGPYGNNQLPLTDSVISTISDTEPYTINLYMDNGTPSNTADDILVATYVSNLPGKRPYLSTELSPASFATVTTSRTALGNFARAGGSLTLNWTLPAGASSDYVNFFRGYGTNIQTGSADELSINVIPGTASSVVLTTTAATGTVTGNSVTVYVLDAFLRDLATGFIGQ